MTTEQKAKAYDKAIEKIKYVMEHSVSPTLNKEDLQDIFPELAESEDERIKKAIKYCIKQGFIGCGKIENVTPDECLTWLEKQAQSTTIIISKDLKGTDTDGGVVGERGEQGEQSTNKNFKERYENIAESDWFKKTHKDISIGEEQSTEEEMVGMGGLGKVCNEQAIISRLDKIIEILSWGG